MEFDKKAFCERMLLMRESKNYSQAEMAKFLGISQSAYSSYELGNRNVSLDIFCKLLDIFDVTPERLLGMPDSSRLSLRESNMVEAFKQFLLSEYNPLR